VLEAFDRVQRVTVPAVARGERPFNFSIKFVDLFQTFDAPKVPLTPGDAVIW
jgi:hypothetical protein